MSFDRSKVLRDAHNQTVHNVSDASDQSDDSTAPTQDMEEQDLIQTAMADATEQWLSRHGKALFALECSKFLAAEKKREANKSRR